jgi:hypothetical protein
MDQSERKSLQKAISRCRMEAAYWRGLLLETGMSGSPDDFVDRRSEICRKRIREQENKAQVLNHQLSANG